MHTTLPQLVLWLSPTAVEGVIVMAMMWRRVWRDLPIFLSYLLFEIARTCFLFLERNNEITYFYSYWVTEALGSFAALCVIKELFDHAFSRHLGLRQLGNVLFQWSLALLFVTAVLIAWMSPGTDTAKVMAGILIAKRAVSFIEAGLLGFLFLFVFAFGIGWQHYVVGVCLGFGIYGAVELAAISARAIHGPVATQVFNWVMMSVNNCCVLIWAAYFLLPGPAKAKQPLLHVDNLLEEWNKALLQLMNR